MCANYQFKVVHMKETIGCAGLKTCLHLYRVWVSKSTLKEKGFCKRRISFDYYYTETCRTLIQPKFTLFGILLFVGLLLVFR